MGALWAGMPAFLKVRFQSSELINTIMLNYIAIFLVSYLVHGPTARAGIAVGPDGAAVRQRHPARDPAATRLHFGLILAVVAAWWRT